MSEQAGVSELVGRAGRFRDAGAGAAQRSSGLPIALWGMLILIASEATLFAALIGSYYFLRLEAAAWPPAGVSQPRLFAPITLAVLLAASSAPMRLAWLAACATHLRTARTWLVFALCLQSCYLAYQLHDFHAQLQTLSISRDAYTSIYYVLLGADHTHVFLGVLFDLWLLWKLAGGLNTYRRNATQAIVWYWHFVNMMTLIVTVVLLSARA